MYATERHDQIREVLRSEGRVSVTGLAELMGVTTETIRRDLASLETAGHLSRVHGGAVPVGRTSSDESHLAERTSRNDEAKRRIAAAALTHFPVAGLSVYLDAGTTTAHVAAAMQTSAAADIVTHALPIAAVVSAHPQADVTVIGGRIRGITGSAVGADTVDLIRRLRPDIAFIGTNGMSAAFGCSTPDLDEAQVKRAIVTAAQRVVLLADSSKFGLESLQQFADYGDIDHLITDVAPGVDLAAALADAGVEVTVA